MTTRVIATAGHVDHGKSTLIRALTGTDPDRLPEEKRRGLTIELGFARLDLGDARGDIHFIDVPGHVRFVGTMLAGVGAIDGCLLVVAATEGWMAQTEEHLRILQLLGVRSGVVAVTMADRVDEAALRAAITTTRSAVRGSFLERGAIVAVDSVSGRGLREVGGALGDIGAGQGSRGAVPRARLWIDRSFSIAGAGTVVTGTLTGAALSVGDSVRILSRKAARPANIRGLETFGRATRRLEPGRRAAVNLGRVAHQSLRRGDVVVDPDRWHETDTIDAGLDVLAAAREPVSSRGAHVVHIGSAEETARLSVLHGRSIAPGTGGFVRLRLPRRLPLAPGDRYVLRDAGTGTTVGGGEILDVAPVLRPSKAAPSRDAWRVVRERGWVEPDVLERLTGVRLPPTIGGWVADPAAVDEVARGVREAVDGAAHGLDLAALDPRARVLVDADEGLEVRNGRVHRAGSDDRLARHPWLAALDAAPFQPPPPSEAGASEEEVRELVRRGLVVSQDGLWFAPGAVAGAAQAAADLLATAPQGFTVSDLRLRLGTTRRFAIALLAVLDRDGVTRRRGDRRIAGPRLPPPDGRA